jgi:transposase
MISNEQKYTIIAKYKNGYTINEISIDMKISVSTVSKWIKRYANFGNVNRKKESAKNAHLLNKIIKYLN